MKRPADTWPYTSTLNYILLPSGGPDGELGASLRYLSLLRFLGKYYYFVYYTAVLLCALFLPKGIVSLAAPIREKWNRLRARRAGAPAMEKGGTADGDHIKN